MNPEYGVFGVAKDTNEGTNPTALDSIDHGHRRDLHQHRLQPDHPARSGGRAARPRPPADIARLAGLAAAPRSPTASRATTSPWAHPNSRFTTTLDNVPNIAHGLQRRRRRADRRDHLRWPYPRPRAADPRDHRPRRGRLRRPDPGCRGDRRGRGQGGRAPLRPDVEPPVHGVRRGRLRRALPRRSSAPPRTSRSSRTSTGSSATRRTATSCGPATATTCARCCGCCSSRTARSRVARPRSASSRPRRS